MAPLFCLRNNVDALQAIEQAAAFSARHGRRMFLMGLGYSSCDNLVRNDVDGFLRATQFVREDRDRLSRPDHGSGCAGLLSGSGSAEPGKVGGLRFAG